MSDVRLGVQAGGEPKWKEGRWTTAGLAATPYPTLRVERVPDGRVEDVGCDEVTELLNVHSAGGTKRVRDKSLAALKSAGFDDESRDVPVDRANTGVLEVVPDETVVGAEHDRRAAMDSRAGSGLSTTMGSALSPGLEAARDLVRAREDVRCDLMRVRYRVSKLLLRHGHVYPREGSTWTVEHRRWLASRRFEESNTEPAYIDALAAVDAPVSLRP